jgi:hypothetical protein
MCCYSGQITRQVATLTAETATAYKVLTRMSRKTKRNLKGDIKTRADTGETGFRI